MIKKKIAKPARLRDEELETVSGARFSFHGLFHLKPLGPTVQLSPGQTYSFGTAENGGSVSVSSSGHGLVQISSWHRTFRG